VESLTGTAMIAEIETANQIAAKQKQEAKRGQRRR